MNSKELRTAQRFLRNKFACVGRYIHSSNSIQDGGDRYVA